MKKTIISRYILLIAIIINFGSIGLVIGDNILDQRFTNESKENNTNNETPQNKQSLNDNSKSIQQAKQEINKNNKINKNVDHTNEQIAEENPSQRVNTPRYSYVDQGTGVINHYIDQQSDVDSSPDKGLHSNFENLKAFDSNFDNNTENEYNVTLIDESFEGTWTPSGWSESPWNSQWTRSSTRSNEGIYSAGFNGGGFNPNYYGWLTSPSIDTSGASAVYIEFWYYISGLSSDNDFEIDLYNGNSWDIDYAGLESGVNNAWNFFSVKITDPQYFKSNFQIRWFADYLSSSKSINIDSVNIKAETGLDLDLETQFTNVAYFVKTNLSIKTGPFSGSENLGLSYWTGSSWVSISDSLAENSWNNFSVILNSPTYTIKFVGKSVQPDSIQDWWQIDVVLLALSGPGTHEYSPSSDTSNVDSYADTGTLSNFTTMKYLDNVYSNISETGGGTSINWGDDSIEPTSSSINYVRCMNGLFSAGTGYTVTGIYISTTASGSGNARLAIYQGGTETDPNGATLVWDAGTVASGIDGFVGISGGTASLTNNEWTWICAKGNDATFTYNYNSVHDSGSDFTATNGRWDGTNSMTSNENFAYESTISDSGTFGSAWYSWYMTVEQPSTEYQMDQEIQWTGVAHFLDEEELQIKTGSFSGGENIEVDYWNGTGWGSLSSSLNESSWNNISIKSYLDSKNFTIRFHDANNVTDPDQSYWLIDSVKIYVNTGDFSPPWVNNLGIDDFGNGTAVVWADVIDDGYLGAKYVTLNISSSDVAMTNNGTHWIYPLSINFQDTIMYQIKDASDYSNNFLSSVIPLSPLSYTFDQVDNVAPYVISASYNGSATYNGTFKTVVDDLWGSIDTVYVNVTSCEITSICIGSNIAILQKAGNEYQGNSLLMKSGPINFTITVNDTFGNVFTSVLYYGTVENKAPSISYAYLTPSLAYTTDQLISSWDFVDVDGDSESAIVNITWYKDGIHQAVYDNLTSIANSATTKGEAWHYLVQVFDGQMFSTTFNSSNFGATTLIINSAPIINYSNISNSFPYTSDNLVAIWGESDPDGLEDIDSGTLNITWYKNGVQISSYDNKTQVNATDTLKGEKWNYILQIYDGEVFSNYYNSTLIEIQNSKPSATSVTFTNTNPTDVDDLIINYTFIDADLGDSPATPIIWWFVKNIYNSDFDNLTVIDNSLTNTSDWYYYIIRVFDGSEYSANITSDGVIIGGTGSHTWPWVSNLEINPLFASTTDDLIANYNFYDAENDPEAGSEIRWFKDGILQVQFNDAKTIPSSATSKGEFWNFTVRARDIFNFNTSYVYSSTIQIINTIPTASGFGLTENPINSTDLVPSWIFSDIDGDLENNNFNLTWYKNGIFQPQLTNTTIVLAGNTSKNDLWYFLVQVYDGDNLSILYNSSTYGVWRIILNTAPVASNLRFNNPNPKTGDNLVANWTYFDSDFDPENISTVIFWYRNSQLIGQLNNSRTINFGYTSKNQQWYFELRVYDGSSYSILYRSPSVQILNTAPSLTGLEITPNAKTTNNIEAKWGNYYFDADGDTQSIIFNLTWYKNSVYQPVYNNVTIIPYQDTSKGQLWYYLLQVSDGSSFSKLYNSSSDFGVFAQILNSLPIASNVKITNGNPTVSDNLFTNWDYFDADSDPENVIVNVTWYKNDAYQPLYDNLSTLPSTATFTKGEAWYFIIQVYDGENFSLGYVSPSITIQNSIPMLDFVTINSGTATLYSNMNLTLFWNYTDADGDIIDNNTGVTVHWYLNGELISRLDNYQIISTAELHKHDRWTIELQIFDGDDFSSIFEFGPVIIQNSEGYVSDVNINNFDSSTNTSVGLELSWIFYDLDKEDQNKDAISINRNITWYKWDSNQSIWIFIPEFSNYTIIPSVNTVKYDTWRAIINIYDGDVWTQYNVSQTIYIENTVPLVSNLEFINPEYQYFFTEDEDLIISYTFTDLDSDFDNSMIKWFINGVYHPQYDNLVFIPSNQTAPGQIWSVQIIPYDNDGFGKIVTSPDRTIEDIPDFLSFAYYPINDTEGHYFFWFDVNVDPINPSGPSRPTVLLNIIINNTESDFVIADWNGTYFVYDWQYTNYSLLNSEVYVIVEASTRVRYSGLTSLISQYLTYNFTFLDTAPPRVTKVDLQYDNKDKPTEMTFIVKVKEFGSSISNATLFYLLEPISDTNAFLANNFKYSQSLNGPNLEGYTMVELQMLNSTHYTVTVNFNSDKSVAILYYIQLSDQSGNLNLNAWPQGNNADTTFRYNVPGLTVSPEQLGIFVIVVFAIVLVLSFIINKKFRSKELVGLDVDTVMKNINKLKPQEIQESINLYSLGTVISFFDQRHGPIPVLYEPSFLKDNYKVLLDLADISFSTGRFVENFTDEEQSSFTFSIDPTTQIKVITFSFSLNRPNARGGAENLMLNIMLSKEVFPLISQFSAQFKLIASKIHRILDSEPEGKDKVGKLLNELRTLVASIALSYLDLYGTIELETSDIWDSYDGEIS